MKHLKSSLSDLRLIFEQTVSIRYLAEPFVSFDESRPASEVCRFMDKRNFDVVGVRRNGLVAGYVNRVDLETGVLDDHFKQFEKRLRLNETKPILEVMKVLRESSRVFVDVMGQVSGIVTKGDLQKAPVRMWLFGIISLLEMQFLRLIRKNKPWEDLITHERLKKAKEILADRQRHNEAVDLADCLQFCDKRTIVLKNKKLRTVLGFETNNAGEDFLKQLENLRNDLDHSQDILTGRWPELVDLAVKAEEILQKAENC